MIELNPIIKSFFPPETPIVFFHAHPDDESFLSAGLIAELSALDRDVHVIFGAAGIVEGQIKTIKRREEANVACKILGVTDIHYLDFCEPKYSQYGGKALHSQDPRLVANAAREVILKNIGNKCILVTYDKNGGYGNKDHKIIHCASRYLKEDRSIALEKYIEVTLNRDELLQWLDNSKSRLSESARPKLSYWSTEFGLPKEEITHFFKLSKESRGLKREALAAHISQISKNEFPLVLSEVDFNDVFGKEYFKVN